MNNVVLIFWPKGGNVEYASKMIAKEYGNINIIPISEIAADTFTKNDKFIIGGSTLGSETWEGTLSESPWNNFFSAVKSHGFSNKKVAIFGLGDQVLWPASFVDGLATIFNAFVDAKATLVGKWPTEGYDFTESLAVKDGDFVGLALDEDQQPELTESRIQAWVKQLKKEF